MASESPVFYRLLGQVIERMDSVYSVSLLISLVTGTIALVLSIGQWLACRFYSQSAFFKWRGPGGCLVIITVGIAFVAFAISFFVHLGWGHQPGTPEALAFPDFLRVHPSFLVAVALPVMALVFIRISTGIKPSD